MVCDKTKLSRHFAGKQCDQSSSRIYTAEGTKQSQCFMIITRCFKLCIQKQHKQEVTGDNDLQSIQVDLQSP